jgi:hypothetical protein
MTLADKISVNAHYTRSVNLERDASSAAVVSAYIPTSRALHTLSRIADTFQAEQSPRAWSLVGPYGSGKSSFALFLAHILARRDREASQIALTVLRQADPPLAQRFTRQAEGSWGHCYVLLTGTPEALSTRLAHALAEGASAFWAGRRGRTPAIVSEMRTLASGQPLSTSQLLQAVQDLQTAVAKSGGNGVLVVVDELGKFLEYEARHYGANDIYLLQALAEHAYADHSAKLTLVALLHQAFEHYAKGLGEHLRNEWAKVQGRFENVPFLESAEQVLRVVAAAFQHDLNAAEWAGIRKSARDAADTLERGKALPGALDADGAAQLFERCYPLHPVSALLLPVLCQKVAQNERTLFSYLGSQEPQGFRDSLGKIERVGEWISPWQIFDYFVLNQPAAVSDHFTHRRWAEVLTALDRLGDAPQAEVELLKTIGLLNIVGAQGGFRASKAIVALCMPSKKLAEATADALLAKSMVQFRKFSGEYRVWQGSDVDLDAAIQEQRSKLGRIDLAESLNQRHTLLPMVVRKYSIRSGALRYFTPTFADAVSFRQVAPRSGHPRIIFFLSQGQDDRRSFEECVKTRFSELDVTVEYLSAAQLREAVSEVLALEAVRRESQELNADPVAQREFKDRYAAAVGTEETLVSALTDSPGGSVWYWNGQPLAIRCKRSLQEELSRVLGEVYHACPVIKNELINRDSLSSQAAAARNKLLVGMLRHADQEDLGIEKFPAEKAIYRALLRASGLHREVDGLWTLAAPEKRDPLNFAPLCRRIEAFLDETEKAPLPFSKLDAELMAPPYGVKAGVLPIRCAGIMPAGQPRES